MAAELLIWPAMIAYGEAVVAYAGDYRGASRAGRLATWGVRVGWLAQTLLLLLQGLDGDGFPWGTWAGALNLLAWLVVSAYLIWGCRPRYRLLGLVVMPVVFGLLLAAWAGGGTGLGSGDDASYALGVHVALMLAGIAALTLAAGMAVLYLWEENRLKRRDVRVLRLRMPPLESLDAFAARSALAGVVLLSSGVVVGLGWLDDNDFDLAMAGTVVVVLLFVCLLGLRRLAGWHGRKAAVATLVGFILVALVLSVTHFAS